MKTYFISFSTHHAERGLVQISNVEIAVTEIIKDIGNIRALEEFILGELRERNPEWDSEGHCVRIINFILLD